MDGRDSSDDCGDVDYDDFVKTKQYRKEHKEKLHDLLSNYYTVLIAHIET